MLTEGIIVADDVVGAVDFAFLGALAFLGAGPAIGPGGGSSGREWGFRLKCPKSSFQGIEALGQLKEKLGERVNSCMRIGHFSRQG